MNQMIIVNPRKLFLILLLLGTTLACSLFGSAPSESTILTPTITQSTNSPTPQSTFTSPPPTATLTPATSFTPSESPSTTLNLEGTVLKPENLSAGDPYSPELGNRGYDVQHYTLALTLDPENPHLKGWVTILALSTEQNLYQISLDFVGFDIVKIQMDGIPISYFRVDDKLIVNLPEPVPANDAFTIEIGYGGVPVVRPSEYVPFISHLGLHFPESKPLLYALAEPDGARFWYPVNDHPRDKAAYRFELTVPSDMVAVANGILEEIEHDILTESSIHPTWSRYIWEHDHPMASAFVTVAVGEYERIEGRSPAGNLLRNYAFPEQRQAFEDSQAIIGEMLDWMSTTFGDYPFDAFGFVSSVESGASLETQTMVVLSEGGIYNQTKLAHEMAHMWFGDWVSLDSWGDMWRSEGFATYVSDMWITQDDPVALDQQIDLYRSLISEAPNDFPLNQPPRESRLNVRREPAGPTAVTSQLEDTSRWCSQLCDQPRPKAPP